MAGFVRETCGPRPLVGGHEVGAQILLQRDRQRQLSPGRLVLMSNAMHRRPVRERAAERGVAMARAAAAAMGGGGRVHRVRHQHQSAGAELGAGDRVEQDLGAGLRGRRRADAHRRCRG